MVDIDEEVITARLTAISRRSKPRWRPVLKGPPLWRSHGLWPEWDWLGGGMYGKGFWLLAGWAGTYVVGDDKVYRFRPRYFHTPREAIVWAEKHWPRLPRWRWYGQGLRHERPRLQRHRSSFDRPWKVPLTLPAKPTRQRRRSS